MGKVHYVPKKLEGNMAGNGYAPCEFYATKKNGEVTNRRKQVTCGNCKRSRIFRKAR